MTKRNQIKELLDVTHKAIGISKDMLVEFITNISRMDGNGNLIQRQVRGSSIVDTFPEGGTPRSAVMICIDGTSDQFDFYERFSDMFSAMAQFIEQPTVEHYRDLAETRAHTLNLSKSSKGERQLEMEKVATLHEHLKELYEIIKDEHIRDIESTTIACSFEIEPPRCERLEDAGLRLFASNFIKASVNTERNVLEIHLGDSVDNFDVMEHIIKLEVLTDKLGDTITKKGNFNKATVKQARTAIGKMIFY